MNAQEIIQFIQTAEKKTPVKVYLNLLEPIEFPKSKVFGEVHSPVVFGDYREIAPILEKEAEKILAIEIEQQARNSAVPLLDITAINARIEPGAIIREQVTIGDQAVIMMGAIINIGAAIGERTMIDMGAILGGRAIVGSHCHIGAGAVLAGVIEPASAKPVVVEDGVLIGANAVIVEGVRIGQNAVVAAGAVVLEDVAPETVVGGTPARVLKIKDEQTKENTALIAALREL
ncbi:MAG: 2,3,4,5-tetrahydropyridine-2,6-dicarboxylate N-acetyltransferase [Enterococcus sp.]